MKIRYKRWQNWSIAALGIMIFLRSLSYNFKIRLDVLFIFDLGFSLFVIFIAIYRWRKGYVVIQDGTITTYNLKARTIRLSEVEQYYRDRAGDYCLVAGKTELRINPEWIDEKSLEELLEILDDVAVRLN